MSSPIPSVAPAQAGRYRNLKELLDHPGFGEGDAWRRVSYDANKFVIIEGENSKNIYVVLSGTLMVCTDVMVSESTHMRPGLCELFGGEEFALSCFFDNDPHCATVKTLTACNLAVIDAVKLNSFLESNPAIGYRILYHWIESLLPCLRRSNKRINSLFTWGLKVHGIDQVLD